MHTRIAFLLFFSLLAFSLQPSILSADNSAQALELTFKNGDRLKGDLIRQTESHVVIVHPHLGELEIAKSALQTLPESLQQTTPTASDTSAAEPAAEPELPSTGKTQPVDQPPSTKKIEPKEKAVGGKSLPLLVRILPQDLIRRLIKMDARIGLAYDIQKSRKDLEDMRFFFNSRWTNGKSNYRFDTDYRFGEVNEEISEDRFQTDLRFRRNTQGKRFFQSNSRYKTDKIREIDHFYDQHIGLGWQLIETPRLKLVGGPEVALHYRDLDMSNEELGGWAYVGSFFQDTEFNISEFYLLEQEASAYMDTEDSENWGYTLEMMVTGKIKQGFSVRLGYEYNYDNQVPKRVPQEEINFYSSLMYTF